MPNKRLGSPGRCGAISPVEKRISSRTLKLRFRAMSVKSETGSIVKRRLSGMPPSLRGEIDAGGIAGATPTGGVADGDGSARTATGARLTKRTAIHDDHFRTSPLTVPLYVQPRM